MVEISTERVINVKKEFDKTLHKRKNVDIPMAKYVCSSLIISFPSCTGFISSYFLLYYKSHDIIHTYTPIPLVLVHQVFTRTYTFNITETLPEQHSTVKGNAVVPFLPYQSEPDTLPLLFPSNTLSKFISSRTLTLLSVVIFLQRH